MMKRVMSEPIRLRSVAPTLSESVEHAVMAGLTRNRDSRMPTVEAFAAELSRVTDGGTQIMGGVVTGQISTSGDGRATAQFGGQQTRVDASPAFTGQSPPGATSGTRANPSGYAPTEITQTATKPQQQEPSPQTRVTTPPVFAAPVTVRDLPPTALADPIVTKPERSSGKWIVLGGFLVLAVIAAIVYLVLRPAPVSKTGFALVIKGAPAGSQVFYQRHSARRGLRRRGLATVGH
jgi:hypothetical protein